MKCWRQFGLRTPAVDTAAADRHAGVVRPEQPVAQRPRADDVGSRRYAGAIPRTSPRFGARSLGPGPICIVARQCHERRSRRCRTGDLGTGVVDAQPAPWGYAVDHDRRHAGVRLANGLLFGVLSALRGGWIGKAIDVLSLVGLMMPSFLVALLFIMVFAVWLRWLPATGYVMFSQNPPAGWPAWFCRSFRSRSCRSPTSPSRPATA